ncbi:kinase-like domain-containing protein [Massariosphaeria phaeospora]|uniref:Kinase-like domain-containing protein n=1 Tax=Massariosphaeria phaeospora TaxID=100035 RepID=A0A7C8I373_9PLEO|nr:kinase-like domain-containing protein [Massariosphaeria phaeospora]
MSGDYTPWIWSPEYNRHYCYRTDEAGQTQYLWAGAQEAAPPAAEPTVPQAPAPIAITPRVVPRDQPPGAWPSASYHQSNSQSQYGTSPTFYTHRPQPAQHNSDPLPDSVKESVFGDRPRRFIRTAQDNINEESLDPNYRRVAYHHHAFFFKRGRVFKMLWTEPAGQDNPGKTRGSTHFSLVSFGQTAYSEIRRFVVIQNKGSFRTQYFYPDVSDGGSTSNQTSPIQTYRRQGARKRGLIVDDHAIIYTGSPNDPAPNLLEGEEITKQALRVQSSSGEQLDAESRINFGKPYAVEHNCKVMDIGVISDEHIHLLSNCLSRRLSCRVRLEFLPVLIWKEQAEFLGGGQQLHPTQPTAHNPLLHLATPLAGFRLAFSFFLHKPVNQELASALSPFGSLSVASFHSVTAALPRTMSDFSYPLHRPAARPLYVEEGKDYSVESDEELPYTLVKTLGHGLSGIVEKVQDINTGRVFALKSIRIQGGRDPAEARSISENEIKIIRSLAGHHHIIRVFATYVTKRHVGLVLDPVADGGDLEDFLADMPQGTPQDESQIPLPEGQSDRYDVLRRSFGCLASGLAFMHGQKIRHKDIKPRNILIHQGSVIFTDFGYSLDTSITGHSTTTGRPTAMTRRYSAPEVVDHANRNSSSDVFSLGCVYLDVLAVLRGSSFISQGQCFSEHIKDIKVKLEHSPLPATQDFLRKLITSMITDIPSSRPTAADIAIYFLDHIGFSCNVCQPSHNSQETVSTTLDYQASQEVAYNSPWIWSPQHNEYYYTSFDKSHRAIQDHWNQA